MSKFKKILIIFLFVVFLGIGLGLTFSNQIKDYILGNQIAKQHDAFRKSTKEQLQENLKKPANFDTDQVNSFSANSVLEDKLKTPPETAFNLIATIGIPSVNLNVPIYNGVDNWNLTYGAGTFSPDQKLGEGNYALASHRATVPNLLFTPLERLNIGEGIFVTDKNKVYEYIVTTKKQVLPSQSEVLDVVKGKKLITLVTCSDDFGTARLIVQGELGRVWDVDKAPKEVLSYLSGEKTTY